MIRILSSVHWLTSRRTVTTCTCWRGGRGLDGIGGWVSRGVGSESTNSAAGGSFTADPVNDARWQLVGRLVSLSKAPAVR
jgi:hypothetical protein